MKRRSVLCLAGCLGICLGIVWVAPSCHYVVVGFVRSEHFYQGMPTSYWRQKAYECSKPYRCFWSLPPEIHDPSPATVLDRLKNRLGLRYTVDSPPLPLRDGDLKAIPVAIDLLKDSDSGVRSYAAETLGAFGPDAAEAIPALTEALGDKEVGGFGITVGEMAERALLNIRHGEKERMADPQDCLRQWLAAVKDDANLQQTGIIELNYEP